MNHFVFHVVTGQDQQSIVQLLDQKIGRSGRVWLLNEASPHVGRCCWRLKFATIRLLPKMMVIGPCPDSPNPTNPLVMSIGIEPGADRTAGRAP